MSGRTTLVRGVATATAVSLALSGCATPYVVSLPELNIAESNSMERALKYLDDTRKVFRSALTSQITD